MCYGHSISSPLMTSSTNITLRMTSATPHLHTQLTLILIAPIHEGLARLSCPVWPVLPRGVITVRALCAVTLWTEMAAKRCGPMPLIASAVPVRDNSSFTVGDTVRVGCQPGYAPVPAPAAVMSHSSRGWSRRGGDVDILSDSSDDESSAAAAASLTLTCLDDLSWSSPTHLCRSASVYATLSYDDSILPPPHTHFVRRAASGVGNCRLLVDIIQRLTQCCITLEVERITQYYTCSRLSWLNCQLSSAR